jgi:hypothetical protein
MSVEVITSIDQYLKFIFLAKGQVDFGTSFGVCHPSSF